MEYNQSFNQVKNLENKENSNRSTSGNNILLILLVSGVTFVIGFIFSESLKGGFNPLNFINNYKTATTTTLPTIITNSANNSTDISSINLPSTEIAKMNQVIDILKNRYVDKDLDWNKLSEGAIKGMVSAIGDAPTIYFTKEETESYNQSLSGGYEGIGAELGYIDGYIIIKRIVPDSPAQKSGLKAGEYIAKIDDYEVKLNDNISDVVSRIRGNKGTVVKLTLVSDTLGSDKRELDITRDTLNIKAIDIFDEANGIVRIRLSRFTEGDIGNQSGLDVMKQEWDNTVNQVLTKNPTKIILDLRGNGGGYLDAAAYIAEDFLQVNDTILHVQDRNGIKKTYTVTRNGRLNTIPLVILVNGGSASASEILAGALQQSGKYKIIGEKTYGKGTAQSVLTENNGLNSQIWQGASLHYTVQRWLLPDKRNITKENPITPDILVQETIEDLKAGKDVILNKALSN